MTNINFSLRPLLPFRIGFFRTILFLTLILGSTDNHAHHNSRLDVPRNGIEFAINPDDRDGGGMEEYLPVSVYVGNIDLLSQTDVSNFSTSITAITGNLTISGADIVNLNALANLTSVSGKVFIYQNPLLSSLTGLNSLAVVGGQLDVILCNALTKWPEWSHLNRFVDCGGEQQSDKYRCFEQSEFRDQFPRNPKQFVIRNGSEIKVQIVDSPRRG